MNAALVRLSLRRALPLPLLAAYAAFLGLLVARSWTPASVADEAHAVVRADAFLRQAVWTIFLVIGAPALVIRAADVGNLWRRRDADWLGSGALGRLPVLVSAWAGILLAAAVLATGTLLLGEGAAGASGPALRLERTLEHEPLVLHPAAERGSVELPPLPEDTHLLVEGTVAPGSGPAATIRARIGASSATARVFGRHTFELEAPGGDAAELSFEREGPGAVFVLPRDSIDVVVPARSTRLGSLELAARTLLAVGAWCAVALALGAWIRTALAAGVTGCLALASIRWLPDLDFLPGAGLLRSLDLVAQGLLPPRPSVLSYLLALVLVAACLGLARLGLERGRSQVG